MSNAAGGLTWRSRPRCTRRRRHVRRFLDWNRDVHQHVSLFRGSCVDVHLRGRCCVFFLDFFIRHCLHLGTTVRVNAAADPTKVQTHVFRAVCAEDAAGGSDAGGAIATSRLRAAGGKFRKRPLSWKDGFLRGRTSRSFSNSSYAKDSLGLVVLRGVNQDTSASKWRFLSMCFPSVVLKGCKSSLEHGR